MESSQGQTTATVEASAQAGWKGLPKTAITRRDKGSGALRQRVQSQTGKLRQWLHILDQSPGTRDTDLSIIESLSFLQSLVEHSPDAIFVKDVQGRYLFVNAVFAAWMQIEPEAVLGKTDAEVFSPKVALQLSLSDAQVFQDGKAFTEEMTLEDLTLRDSGAERNLLTTKIPFRSEENQIIGLLGMARDNTLRKLMEDELREAKQFNEQVIASAREGVVVYDADLRYAVWNSFMEEFSGIPRHKIIGRHPLEVFPTIRETGMMDLIERAFAGETVTCPDLLVNSGHGLRNAWAASRFGPLRDAKGDIIGVIAIISDITEHKRAEAKLRRSQQFNQQVIANASEGIVVYDREMRVMVWNPVLEDLSGLQGQDVLGRPILEMAPHWRNAGLREMLKQALQGDTVEAPDYQIDPQRDRWVASRYSPLVDKDDQVIGVIGILTEVTARRHAEEALRESEQFNQQVINSALEGIAVYDRDLHVVVWNPAMEHLMNVHRAQVLGEHLLDVFPHLRNTESPEMWARALAGETINEREFQFNEGGDRWASASYGPLCNPRGEIVGVIATMRDITPRKHAEEALRASQQFNQQVIANAREGIIVYDADLRYLVWNPAMEQLSGVPAERIIGQRSLEVGPLSAKNGVFESLQQAVLGQTPPRYDYEYDFGDGYRGYCSRQDAPLLDELGTIVGVISVISEITDRKKAEEELRESQQFNQEIIVNAREGIVVYDQELNIRLWNKAMEELSGLASASVFGRNIYEVFPQFRDSAVPARLAEALEGKSSISKDFELKAEGSDKQTWLSARYGPHRNSKGEIVGVIVTIRDITSRKRAEDELRQSEERYREILVTLQDGYWEINLANELYFFNEAVCEIYGRAEDALKNTGFLEYLTKDSRQSAQAILEQVLTTGAPVKAFGFEIQRGDGELRQVETSIALIRQAAGEPFGYRGILRDVTERKQAEQKLRERDERFRALIENSHDGIMLISATGELLYVSPSYTRIHGYEPEAVMHSNLAERVHPDDLVRVLGIRESLPPGACETFEYRVRHQSGEYRWIEGRVTNLLHEPSVRAFVNNFHDITERKLAEAERAQADARLKASEARSRALITNSWEGISLQDRNGNIVYVGPSYTRLLGYDQADVLNSDQAARFHPDDLALMQASRVELLSEPGKQMTLEHRVKHKDGSWRWLESRATNLLDDPAIGAIVVNFHDITERKQAEDSLRSREQRFRALVENGFDGISLQDAEGFITYVSPTYQRILGYDPEEVIGQKPLAKIHPDEVNLAIEARQEILEHPGARRTLEFRARHKTGGWRRLEVTMTNLLADPSVGAVVVNFRDISERYESERALRESEEKFRAIWDGALDAMLIVNDDMQYVDANPAACALYGVSRDELIACSMADFVAPEKRTEARRSLSKLIRQGERSGHFHLVRSDHTIHQIEYSARANFLPGLHLSVMRDVTEKKRAEDALRASEEQYRSLVSVLEEGILLISAEGDLLTCNESAERILGTTRLELRERGLLNPAWRAIKEDGTPFRAEDAPSEITLHTGQPCSSVVLGIQRPAGDTRWLSVSSQPVYQQDSERPQAVVISISDITERKIAEVALRKSEALFAAAFDASPLAVTLAELPTGKLTKVNQAWCRMFGYQVEEAIGSTTAELGIWHEPAARNEFLQRVEAQGEAWEYEAQLRTRAGELRHALISAQRIELEQKQYVIILKLDITERKLAEESFTKAFEANPNPMALLRIADATYAQVNSAWSQLAGYAPAEIAGRSTDEINHWVDADRRAEFYRLMQEQGRVRDFEGRFYARDQHEMTFLISGEFLEINGEPHILVSGSDISERKQAEDALRVSEERFATAFNASPDALAITTFEEGRFVMVNAAWIKTFGYSQEAALTKTFLELDLLPDPAQRQFIFETVRAQGALRDYEVTARLANGVPGDLLMSAELVKLGDERFVLSVSKDITERKRAEAQLRASEERFAAAFTSSPQPMVILDVETRQFVNVNEDWLKLFGYKMNEVLGKTGLEINQWVNSEQREQLYAIIDRHQRVRDFECSLQNKAGAPLECLVSADVIELAGRRFLLSTTLDVTASKQAQQALQRSETRFSKTFNACPEPMALVRWEDGRIISVNQAWQRALGREEHELIGRTSDEIKLWVHEEQRIALEQLLAMQHEVRDFECDYYVKDGRIGHFLISAENIEIDGQPHVLSVARDITERKRAEEALRASEERFSRAFNSSPQPIAITTLPEGRFLAVNHAWTKSLGYTPEEAVGHDVVELALLVDREQRRKLYQAIGKEQAVRDLELTLRAKNGELRYLIVFGEVIQLASEDYLLLTALDVTERKLAETALRDTEQRYKLLFERNVAGVYRATLEGEYLDCNAAFAGMFGFASPEELKLAGAWSLYADPAIRAQMITDLHLQRSLNNYEMPMQRRDGSLIWVLTNITLLEGKDEEPSIYEGIVLDITKRKQDEAKLAESREQLRALSARLSAIREEERAAIAREIHDSLGQMLTGLKLDVAWLHKRLATGVNNGALTQEHGVALVQKAEGMADLLDNTIQTVRDLATQLRPGVLDTLGLTAAIEWQVQDFQSRTNIECEVWLCPEPKDLAKEKATALFRILQEILTNIIRHAEATRVVIHLLPADDALLLSVADNGRGITTGNLRDAKSLGLLGMRERALMIGGEVNFDGSPERGTTVTVRVPL